MVEEATSLEFEIFDSELEAILIEAELIRLHQPPYNVLLKDDKTPIYLHIKNVPFPAVKLIRKRDLVKSIVPTQLGITLGPFSSSYKLKQVLKIARKIFPWCDEAEKKESRTGQSKNKSQACFHYHLDLCPGACIGLISKEKYQQNIEQLTLFLKGKTREVTSQLKTNMRSAAKKLEFEKAAKIKQQIELIREVTSKHFKLKPDLILPALHDSRPQHSLDHLRHILIETGIISSDNPLDRIEGYDVSNLQGKNAAVSMVVFEQGQPEKSQYRLFNIRQLNKPNDYQMLKQAIARRSKHAEWTTPNLVVVDGGKGQVRAALYGWHNDYAKIKNKTLQKNSKQTNHLITDSPTVIGIAKQPDRLIIPLYKVGKKSNANNKVKAQYQVITLPQDHPALHLIQQIRDESHRFAKKQHIRLRRKDMFN